MITPSPTGRQFTLSHGDQEAVVTERGAGLREYRVGGRDVVVPYEADEEPPAMHGAILAPWPNRLADGRYTFDGATHQLPIDEPERQVAIHGFVHKETWQLLGHSADQAELGLQLTGRPGYPFALHLRVHYQLDAGGLTIRLATSNTGDDRAPYGVGFHPWLSPGAAAVDDCRLAVDAGSWIRTNERLLPVDTVPIPAEMDFTRSRRISTASLDEGYADATYRRGRSWVRLAAPDGSVAAVWMEPPLAFWQVCTGDFPETGSYERTGVAGEPMSCPANAFVSGDHLAVIEPGATHTVTWGLRLEREGTNDPASEGDSEETEVG
ncbi:aldose 1-epimerase [Raineyella antarctica]|uniref:Aldose 1-epimerase n=1 Tax=Raineyella antarctica TaxID=1577474 RepID=A0A1G6GHR0_9ACTN|nr:aldose 1-epimerase family protein [Raineyella antarctica]SDB81383.1 aldose 1-epimerase [Raineyella antarctica]